VRSSRALDLTSGERDPGRATGDEAVLGLSAPRNLRDRGGPHAGVVHRAARRWALLELILPLLAPAVPLTFRVSSSSAVRS
jgi:hypothetical protein